MELSNLLNAMVQGAETDALAQIQSRGQAGSNAMAQARVNPGGQPGGAITGQTALTLAAQPPALNVTGQPGIAGQMTGSGPPPTLASAGQPGVTGQPGLGIAGQAGSGSQTGLGLSAAAGQPTFTLGNVGAGPNSPGLTGQPGLSGGQPGSGITGQLGLSAGQQGLSVTGQPGASGLTGQSGLAAGQSGQLGTGVGFQPATALSAGHQGGLPALVVRPSPSGLGADTYYGSEAPASPSLLSQNGVGAYIQLLNAFSTHEASDRTANVVTNNLGTASATLKSTYFQAVATLPGELQQKDWGFSVSNGALVFTQGKDALSAQDLTTLQKAFANVEFSAREVAAAITAIAQRRQSGADSGSLAWGGLEADDGNFSDVVNLRSFVTTSAPGSNYHPNTPDPAIPPQIPNLLGGMDLRDLVSARPNFFRADGSVVTETEEENEDATATAEDLGILQGQCSCGHVRFSVENTFEYAFFCHCSRCRIRTGSAFATIAGIGIDKVQVTAGSDDLLIEGECSDGYGARCSRCHVFLFAAVRERQYMHVSLGVLEGTPNRLPDHHIYVGSKAPWFEITDELPQYDELP
jgi:hypothetical protein